MKLIKDVYRNYQIKLFKSRCNHMYEKYRFPQIKEKQNKFNFCVEFLRLFGIDYTDGTFEYLLKYKDGSWGYIDYLIEGVVLIEFKSTGENPLKAMNQATKYYHGLSDEIKPQVMIVTDFNKVWVYDFENKQYYRDCYICELYFYFHDLVPLLEFANYMKYQKLKKILRQQDPKK